MQQARQFCTAVGYLAAVEQSPTGGHDLEPELVQVPAAEVRDRRASKGNSVEYVNCILNNDFQYDLKTKIRM